MMKHEFEALAGYEVSHEDYNNIIEPMYMATDLSKQDFVKVIDRKRFEVKREKSQEMLELEANIKTEIKGIKEAIRTNKATIEMYKTFYEEDGDSYWKKAIKTLVNYNKNLKHRLDGLNFVLR